MNKQRGLLSGIVLVFVLLSVGSAFRESLTFDEIIHIEEGTNHLKDHTFNIDTYNPPFIRELTALPIILGLTANHLGVPLSTRYFPSRCITIFLGVLLILSVFMVTRRLTNQTVAIIAASFTAFNPNIIAHSHYVSLDIGFTLFFFLAYSSLVYLLHKKSVTNLVFFCIFSGLAAASKISWWLYFPVSTIILLLHFPGARIAQHIISRWSLFVFALFLFAGTIWAPYFFATGVVLAQREDASRISEKMLAYATDNHIGPLIGALYFLKNQPVPLGNYAATLKNNVIRSVNNGKMFFLGSFYGSGRWYFMPITIFLKTPIPLLFLFLYASYLFFRKGKIGMIWIYIAPVIGIIIGSSFFGLQPWIRYVLPIYPFLAIICALAAEDLKRAHHHILVFFLFVWLIGGVLKQFPHYVSYANEFAGPGDTRYRLFMDSNLDWGQGLPDIVSYIQKVEPKLLSFSYFGRDDGDRYGLVSNRLYGSHIFEDICAFHEIPLSGRQRRIIAISVSNWYQCGFFAQPAYAPKKIRTVVGESLLIF